MAKSSFTASDILAKYKSTKFARPNRFEIIIDSSWTDIDTLHLSLMAEDAQFLGRNINTSTYSAGYEATYDLPDGMTYADDYDITFLLTDDHREVDYFKAWQDRIYDINTHDINYYHTYIGTMNVRQLDQNNEVVREIRINECYPKTIDAIGASHSATSEFSKLKVTFSFKDWDVII